MLSARYRPIAPELDDLDVDGRSIHAFRHGYPCPLVRWHRHDEIELHLIVEGTGRMFVGDHVGSFAPGQLVLLGAQLPHNWVSEIAPDEVVEFRDHVVQFRRDLLPAMAAGAPELAALLPLLARAQGGIEFTGPVRARAAAWTERMIESDGLTRIALLIDFLGQLGRETRYRFLSTASAASGADADSDLGRIGRVKRYVAANHAQDIRLHDVAALSGMSETSFSRFFTKATGGNFNRYLSRVRIASACERLGESDESVTDICFAVGFKNVANFNRRFRQYKAMTPREYRARIRAGLGSEPAEASSVPGARHGD